MKTTTKERGIMFSGPMVRALLEDRKTQTRRVVKPQPDYVRDGMAYVQKYADAGVATRCPYGQPGDALWCREAWAEGPNKAVAYRADGACGAFGGDGDGNTVFYKHGHILEVRPDLGGRIFGLSKYGGKWKSPIFMPRWASRLTLEITDVRVERVQSISEMDALAEGIEELEQGPPMERFWAPDGDDGYHSASHAYAELWDSINGKTHPWASNPWVWAISFKRVEAIEAGRSE